MMLCPALCAAALFIGCARSQGPAETSGFDQPAAPSPSSAVINARWPFWPVRMRLHPLTRLTTDQETGEPIIEARLEFRDQVGDMVKSVGQARFDLHDRDPRLGVTRTLESWELDLRDIDVNRVHYDDLTQTYVFRLQLNGIEPPTDAALRAYFLSVSGRRYEVTGPVR